MRTRCRAPATVAVATARRATSPTSNGVGGGPAERERASTSRLTARWSSRSISSIAESRAAAVSGSALGIGLQPRQLELATRDRDRCAQLVAGVVEEDALVLQRVLDAFEQVVEPASELGELLSGVLGHRQAPAELPRRAGRDHVGVLDHLLHGRERGAGEEPAGDGHQHREQREADGERELQPVLGSGRLLERGADHDHLAVVTDRAGPQPGPLAAGPGVAHERDLVPAGTCELGAAEDGVAAQRSR